MREYTDNPLFNDMANMVDTIKAERCQFPGCEGLRDHPSDDYCGLHEKSIEDAREEWEEMKASRQDD
jgi:hypothetical protein